MKRLIFVLCCLLLLCGCRAKTGINARIDDAAFVVVRIYEEDTAWETTITDPADVDAIKKACHVRGEYEDGGFDHSVYEIVFAGEEAELVVSPSLEYSDYMRTSGGIWYRTGLDRREELKDVLEKYGIYMK